MHYLAQMDPIRYLFKKATLSIQLAQWLVLLCEFDLIYRALKVIKEQVIADHLVGLPLEAYQPLETNFPYEEILALENVEEVPKKYLKLYFDSALNS